MNISRETLDDLKIVIREFQENIAKLVENATRSDRVYHMNLQLFPISKPPGSDR